MKIQVEIKGIDWIDEVAKEAEVCFRIGNSAYWAFCSPCDFSIGSLSNIEINFLEDEEISYETFFTYNINKEMKIVPFDNSRISYYCYGKIISVNPIVVDCGDIQFDYGEFSNDKKVVGEYVYFVIARLDILSR